LVNFARTVGREIIAFISKTVDTAKSEGECLRKLHRLAHVA